MTRFPIHVILLLILGCGAIRSSAGLSLDDKVKESESRLETKIIQLEEKVTHLENQLEQNVSFYLVSKEFYFFQSALKLIKISVVYTRIKTKKNWLHKLLN